MTDRKIVSGNLPAEFAERVSDSPASWREAREVTRPEEPEPLRSQYVGGSDIGAIIGVSERRTALEVWESKLGLSAPPDERLAEMLAFRQDMEDAVLRAFFRTHPEIRRNRSNVRVTAPLDEAPRLSCQIDATAIDTRDGGSDSVVVEAKTANERAGKSWGEAGSDEIDAGYVAQVQWQLGLTGWKRGFLAAAIGMDGDLRVWEFERDEEMINYMMMAARQFWREHVLAKVPPAPRRSTEVRRYLSRLVGVPVELSADGASALGRVFDLRAQIAALEKEKDTAEYRVFEDVRKAWSLPVDPTVAEPTENAILTHEGSTLAVYPLRSREAVDVARLRAEDPMTYHKFRRTSIYRVLSKPPKGR
jgi:putative phage-type endonuclease